jgi:hypothetical protein
MIGSSSCKRQTGGKTVAEQSFDPDGPPADCWVFGGLVYVHKWHVAAAGYGRDELAG